MFKYTVRIEVDPPHIFESQPGEPSTGNFVYSPALLRVQAGDSITWTCEKPFSLAFKEGTPIEQMEIFGTHSGGNFTAGPYTVLPARGQFHYVVAVWSGSQIFVDAACPRISVN
jgi:plastocyanin